MSDPMLIQFLAARAPFSSFNAARKRDEDREGRSPSLVAEKSDEHGDVIEKDI